MGEFLKKFHDIFPQLEKNIYHRDTHTDTKRHKLTSCAVLFVGRGIHSKPAILMEK